MPFQIIAVIETSKLSDVSYRATRQTHLSLKVAVIGRMRKKVEFVRLAVKV